MPISRRDFLRFSAALGIGSRALHGFGLQLAALGASQRASGDYKAIVCIFLAGGNDAANMVLATDADSWGRYQSARSAAPSPIALAAPGAAAVAGGLGTVGAAALGGVLPIVPKTAQPWPMGTVGTGLRTFALHPLMANVQQLFQQGHAAVLANVGPLLQPTTRAQYLAGSVPVPVSLFSHNDQISTWETGSAEGAQLGWGGLMGDPLASLNPAPVFTAISLSGNVPLLAGNTIHAYQTIYSGAVPVNGVVASSLFGSSSAPAILKSVIAQAPTSSPFQNGYASVVARSMASQGQLNAALQAITPAAAPPPYLDPVTGKPVVGALSLGLQAVANLIAAGRTLGMKRQIFFLDQGGYDFHTGANAGHHGLLAGLDAALGYFYGVLGSLGGTDMTSQVTAFTMSEFGRNIISNGTGTDHGWGGHHLVVGGAVKGGDMYGTYPTVGVDLGSFVNPDGLPNTGGWIPTTSVDQYAATLGSWMGLTDAQLLGIFPNLANFTPGGLGFL